MAKLRSGWLHLRQFLERMPLFNMPMRDMHFASQHQRALRRLSQRVCGSSAGIASIAKALSNSVGRCHRARRLACMTMRKAMLRRLLFPHRQLIEINCVTHPCIDNRQQVDRRQYLACAI
jgi:hypothetical protein